ncbi:MAG: radical SAM protein [Oscillospiraceae bacterium]|nr:radical SAM protein [Oscillospiraceae bacterium]
MKTNASIFIPHLGCPHECSFCNKESITEASKSVTSASVEAILETHVKSLRRRNMNAEIAFFGGTFTALADEHREELLQTANRFIRLYPDLFTGIRCSTRPDYINAEILSELKRFNVTSIEIGAQSMDDEVLLANTRGHTTDDVRNAARLVKSHGFELGLQMMTGLYCDTPEKSLYTCDELIKLNPDTVRIYPTVVFAGTKLAELAHIPFSEEETLELVGEIYSRFVSRNIRVIRIGLNYSGNVIGEKSISRYYYNRMREFMQKSGETRFRVFTDKRNISKINGHKCENKLKLEKLGFTYKIKEKQGIDLEIFAIERKPLAPL